MKELTVGASFDQIEVVTDFVNETLEALGGSVRARLQLDVAIDEIMSNIVRYAYSPGTGSVTVRLEALENPPAVRLSFIDRGVPYDPFTARQPDVSAPAEERAVGGLGIYLVRKTMDEVRYEYLDGQNILHITKRI